MRIPNIRSDTWIATEMWCGRICLAPRVALEKTKLIKLYNRLKLRAKLVSAFLLLGLLPMAIASVMTLIAINKTAAEQMNVLEGSSYAVMDSIERNLFERYGDVQAYGFNRGVQTRTTGMSRTTATRSARS